MLGVRGRRREKEHNSGFGGFGIHFLGFFSVDSWMVWWRNFSIDWLERESEGFLFVLVTCTQHCFFFLAFFLELNW